MPSAPGSSTAPLWTGRVRAGAVLVVLVGLTGYLLAPAPPVTAPTAAAADALTLGTLVSVPASQVPRDLAVVAGTGTRFIIEANPNTNGAGLYTPDNGKTWQDLPAEIARVNAQTGNGGNGPEGSLLGYGGTFVGLTRSTDNYSEASGIQRWDPGTGTVKTLPYDLSPLTEPEGDDDTALYASDYVGSRVVLTDGRIFDISGSQAVPLTAKYAAIPVKLYYQRYALTKDGATVVRSSLGRTGAYDYLSIARTDGSAVGRTVKVKGLLSMDVSALTIHYLVGTASKLTLCKALVVTPAKASCTTLATGDYRGPKWSGSLNTSAGADQVYLEKEPSAAYRQWLVMGGSKVLVATSFRGWKWLPFRDTVKPMTLTTSKAARLPAASTVSRSGKATPLFTAPAVASQAVIESISTNRVTYSQDRYSRSTGITRSTWYRPIREDGTLGREIKLLRTAAFPVYASANRTAVEWDEALPGESSGIAFYDGTTRTGTSPGKSSRLRALSGPYALVKTQVVRVDGHRFTTGPILALFGSLAVEASSAKQKAGRTFKARDLARPSAPAVPVNLPQPTGRVYSNTDWKAWGEWVVAPFVDTNDARGWVALNYRTQQAFTIPNSDGWIYGLGDGWVLIGNISSGSNARVRVLTTGQELTLPVAENFAGLFTDGVRTIAWGALTADSQLQPEPIGAVSGLPMSAPRLLGALKATSFTATRSHRWTPRFDLTKAIGAGTLELRNSAGTLVRNLPTSANRTGSVRGISWDGRNTAGKKVPRGTYTWTLTVTALDGSGTALSVDGLRAAIGTVKVSR